MCGLVLLARAGFSLLPCPAPILAPLPSLLITFLFFPAGKELREDNKDYQQVLLDVRRSLRRFPPGERGTRGGRGADCGWRSEQILLQSGLRVGFPSVPRAADQREPLTFGSGTPLQLFSSAGGPAGLFIKAVIQQLPDCRAVVISGQKLLPPSAAFVFAQAVDSLRFSERSSPAPEGSAAISVFFFLFFCP